jgi:Rieske Fe-S protein
VFGLMLVSYPFIASWSPNARSHKIVEINIASIPAGSSKLFEWRGKPVVFYKPTLESSQYLIALNNKANGPDYNLDNLPDFFIYEFMSTHLGCMLIDTGPKGHESYKLVGYWDPCHRGFWDYAGRLLPPVHGGEGLEDLRIVEDYIWISKSVIRLND